MEDLHFEKNFEFDYTVTRCRKTSHEIVTNKQDLWQFLSNSLYIFELDPEPLYRGTVKAFYQEYHFINICEQNHNVLVELCSIKITSS